MSLLLVVAAVLAVWRGFRPKYEGVRPTAVWRSERDLRAPGRIVGRWARVAVATGLLVGAAVTMTSLALVVATSIAVVTCGVLLWYGLTRIGYRVAPQLLPIEDPDLDDDVLIPESTIPTETLEIPHG